MVRFCSLIFDMEEFSGTPDQGSLLSYVKFYLTVFSQVSVKTHWDSSFLSISDNGSLMWHFLK